jgi:uncharacterized protein YndB with AHSA1/START domain
VRGDGVKTAIDVTAQIEINAPRDAVWAIVADPARLPEWFEEMESAYQESDGPPGIGSVVRYTMTQGHRSGTFDIVEWEPGSKLSWDGQPLRWAGGAARPRGSFELAETGDGRTLFTGRFKPELSGTQVVLRPYVKHWASRARERSAAKLKEMAEGSTGS